MFESGAWPMPSLYDSTHRMIMAAALPTAPNMAVHVASLPGSGFLKAQEAMYKNAAMP